jgi:hypothetical protein
MKKLLLICTMLTLAGCAGQAVPVTAKFPDVPKDLTTACADLGQLDPDQVKELSQVLENVTANYSQYYDCKVKVDDWIEWYNSQKKIFNSLK